MKTMRGRYEIRVPVKFGVLVVAGYDAMSGNVTLSTDPDDACIWTNDDLPESLGHGSACVTRAPLTILAGGATVYKCMCGFAAAAITVE